MEAVAYVPELEGLYSSEDEVLIMSQLLANYCSVTNDHQPSSYECSTAMLDMDQGIANLYSRRIMASNYHNDEPFHHPWDAKNATNWLNQGEENASMQVMGNCNVGDHEVVVLENPKKRSCISSEDHVQKKKKRNVKPKKTNQHKPVLNTNLADSSSSGDDEFMNANNPPHQDLSKKARTTRGLATNPQRTYAKNRRDKINSRLRTLQNLVPNGTKVDISTMLEGTVEYVKFLQLQIKLLSSDELWMYAPIVNNGIGMRTSS